MDTRRRLEQALAARYRIERELGEGGMARVFLAEDLKHRRPVAIKVLRPELTAAFGAERFLREIETVARLQHPNILALHDSGEADGLLYFVMPFVEGESLRALLDREKRLPLAEAVRITREIGDALQYAHEHGLVHRDIKPENVLFQAGHALVCDFGIAQVASEAQAHLTRTGVAVGTFTYMSPEQLGDEAVVDRRSDVYALGCVLYEMLAGEVPFPATSPRAALAKKLTGDVGDVTRLRPDVPPTIQEVLRRALAVEPGERHATAGEFTRALEQATTTAFIERDAQRRRRGRVLRGAVLGAGMVIMATLGWWLSALLRGPSMERIAVLPFANPRGDSTQAYYVQGMHGDLVLELARAGIRVISSASVARYADGSRTPREIARELEVDGVVQGSATVAPGNVAVQLQLVHGRSEEVLWTESFQARPRDIVGLYRDVARALATEIGVRLDAAARARLAEAQEVDPQVYDALLQARFQWQKLTEAGFATALEYYQLALARDSLCAEAWVGIMRMWNGRAQMGIIPATAARPHADSALARALAIDPALSGVQSEMAARLTWVEWNWPGALTAFERALDADPTDSETRAYYAHLLLFLDRDAEALEQARQAVQLDPFNTLVQALYGMTLNFLHRPADALAALQPVLERDPQAPIVLSTLRTTYHLLGRQEEALRMWRASFVNAPDVLAALERGYRTGGYAAALRAVAGLRVARAATTYARPWAVGTLYVRGGAPDRAIGYLEQAMAERDPNMPYVSVDPIFDPIRREPRFRALMDRLGLPQ
ncbi:MAG: hypothetical protein FIB01_11370 [Gemmatimonadetes bacterium]|nr:hypothetical protein [Gemmatimonadota bacterium]